MYIHVYIYIYYTVLGFHCHVTGWWVFSSLNDPSAGEIFIYVYIYIINQQLLYVNISILLAKAPKLKRRVRGEEHVGAVITAACRDW